MDWVTASRHFVMIVESGSFAEAARKRYTSSSAISKQIAWLEDRLRSKLLHRTTRHLSLTEAGEAFYVQAKKILDNIDCLETSLQQNCASLRGVIRLSCAVVEQQTHLLQLIPEFLSLYPNVSIELIIDQKQQDLAAEGIDLAIRRDYSHNTLLHQEKLGPVKMHVYGSPDYFEKNGIPNTPQDLLNHNCLFHTAFDKHKRWEFADDTYLTISGNFSSNSTASLIDTAKHGLGLIQVCDFLVQSYVVRGKLIPVLQDYVKPCAYMYAVYPKQPYPNRNVNALIEFLKSNYYLSSPFHQPCTN